MASEDAGHATPRKSFTSGGSRFWIRGLRGNDAREDQPRPQARLLRRGLLAMTEIREHLALTEIRGRACQEEGTASGLLEVVPFVVVAVTAFDF